MLYSYIYKVYGQLTIYGSNINNKPVLGAVCSLANYTDEFEEM